MKKIAENIHGVEIGNIFYTRWGYDQTNVDYFEVISVSPKMATVRPIHAQLTETEYMSGKAVPIPGNYIINSSFCKSLIKTKTTSCDGETILNNADGYGHRGLLYKGKPVDFTTYA